MFYDPASIGWQRATRRAVARGITARLVASSHDQHSSLERYETSSHSHPDCTHYVALVWTVDGLSTVACDCEAGQAGGGQVCQHAAAAVLVAYELTIQDAFEDTKPETAAAPAQPWTDGNFISDLMNPGVF